MKEKWSKYLDYISVYMIIGALYSGIVIAIDKSPFHVLSILTPIFLFLIFKLMIGIYYDGLDKSERLDTSAELIRKRTKLG